MGSYWGRVQSNIAPTDRIPKKRAITSARSSSQLLLAYSGINIFNMNLSFVHGEPSQEPSEKNASAMLIASSYDGARARMPSFTPTSPEPFVKGNAAAKTDSSGGNDSSYMCSGGALPFQGSSAGKRLMVGVYGPVQDTSQNCVNTSGGIWRQTMPCSSSSI
jgi:hypothetical protein